MIRQIVVCVFLTTAVLGAQQGALNGEWRTWGGDLGATRYAPLDQINAANFNSLQIAWRFKTENLGTRPDFNLQTTPLFINGVLYATAGEHRNAVALDAGTGELLWMHRLEEGTRAQRSSRRLSGRGVGYWTDGKGDERVFYVTIGYQLVGLDAKTGKPLKDFGVNGVIDLKKDIDQDLDPVEGEIAWNGAPVVAKNVVLVGAAHRAGTVPRSRKNAKGYIRAYDARTGKRLWIFHTIPIPGEFGNETWLEKSWEYTGNTGVWTQLTVDEQLGIAYLPVEIPTGDYYGGHRPGNNLFAGSLVCLEAKTGKRVWHHQLVHHDIWDYDIASPPNLINITVNGKPIRAVAQVTKQSYVFVFDRVTGAPIWPIEERKVPGGDTPGEWYSPTQPHPTKPAPFDHQGVQEKDLIDFTPELNAQAREIFKQYRSGPLFTPPSVRTETVLGTLQLPGNQGSALWPGAAWDPETNMLYVPSVSNMTVQALQPGGTRSDMTYIGGAGGGGEVAQGGRAGGPGAAPGGRAAGPAPQAGVTSAGPAGPGGPQNPAAPAAAPATPAAPGAGPGGGGGGGGRGGGRGGGAPAGPATFNPTPQFGRGAVAPLGPGASRGPWGLGPQGLPLVKPPYGRITAYNMNTGDIAWQVANGESYDWIKNHPALKGLTIPKTGRADEGGLVVTKTLVFAGQGCGLFRSGQGGSEMFYAYDKATGAVVHEMTLPGGTCGNPMTYAINGKQYIAVSVGSRTTTAEIVALALP